ncbi:hypothetical protein HPULCUR_007188 [Helicostylum pulchrum]|uniref:Trehalase n=1 Tax=Helicostylum pulchrum TaxID=562976 RepID=A0ABP9Y417_9FUNG
MDIHAPAKTYYTTGHNHHNAVHLSRTLSGQDSKSVYYDAPTRQRRASHDEKYKPRKFLLNVKETQQILVEQEDTDGDFQITVNDLGPKSFAVGTADSGGYKKIEIRGTYMLSNLLQELALAQDYGRQYIILDEARLTENPVDRLSRMIRHQFWDGLTRTVDAEGLERICMDPKNRSANHQPRIYIPFTDTVALHYYQNVATTRPHLNLQVQRLPQHITPEYVHSINQSPGILSLALKQVKDSDDNITLQGVPFVVPGGRFNEMYGWDSYFEALGLLVDDRIDLAQGMVENFAYEIKHYGKILNANRSYYLTRSQPPFLTDMAYQVYLKLPKMEESKSWLRIMLQAAIKEYHTVWMSEPRLDPVTQLSRFRPTGQGIPPETEASHFDHVIQPYALRTGLSISEFMKRYNDQTLIEPDLDEYFLHDRAVRESGHDTTYRYEGRCANLATIDLNSLLYKYETDLAYIIDHDLDGQLTDETGIKQDPHTWNERAAARKSRIDRYLWNQEKGMYFDYDTVTEQKIEYETVTTFWAMWAKCASQEQAEKMAQQSLCKFEVMGGLVSGTEASRGIITLDRPNRQWDFPFGWAPHQMLAWRAFENYGMMDIQQRLVYRWLYIITKSFVDFNGVVPEKYDVVGLTHKVQVEYGNVGVDFKYVPREGFGWMNASYQIGLNCLTKHLRRALGACMSPEIVFENSNILVSKQAAQAITENGQVTTAITVIVPPQVLTNDENSNSFIHTPSLSPDHSVTEDLNCIATPNDELSNSYFQ